MPAVVFGIAIRQDLVDPSARTVPVVPIHFPPGESLRTFRPVAAGDRRRVLRPRCLRAERPFAPVIKKEAYREKVDDFRQHFTDMVHLRASDHTKIARAVYKGIKAFL